MERDFDFRIDMKTARKLKSAMEKGEFNLLTQSETNALTDFICELIMQTQS